jgi:NADH-quinone oxidoreductase subunit G
VRHPDEWLCVALPHIFGSEELSVLTPGVAERIPPAYVALNPDDLARAGFTEGHAVLVSVGGESHRLVVRPMSSLPQGIAGLPIGLPSLPWLALPGTGRIVSCETSR